MGGFEFPGQYYEIIRRDFRDLDAETGFFASLLPDGGTVLDLGSGTGTNLRELSKLGYSGIGVDSSANFVDYAKNVGNGDVEYVHSSLTDFDTDQSFDLVYTIFATLNLVPPEELPGLLAKVRRWLKPGGHFVIDAGHLLNFVDNYQPYLVAHHDNDGLLITRLTRILLNPHEARWRNEETLLVSDPSGQVSVHRNFFDQWVITGPELRNLLSAAGLEITTEYGNFRNAPPAGIGRGPLIQVVQAAGDRP